MCGIRRRARNCGFPGDVSGVVDVRNCCTETVWRFDVFESPIYIDEPLWILIREINADNDSRRVHAPEICSASDSLGIIQRLIDATLQNEAVTEPGCRGRVGTHNYTVVINTGGPCPQRARIVNPRVFAIFEIGRASCRERV